MNFGTLRRSELEAMLRRLLLAVFMVALSAGFTAPGGAFMSMDCEQVSLQAPATDCGTEGMPADACTLACHAGPCIAPAFAGVMSLASIPQLAVPPSARHSDRVRAPDTAPPKHSVA
jgi:hypothetical protein